MEYARQYSALFIILRRMRVPLIALILSYAVGLLGLVLIPGADAQGNPWRMGFFHAFYVLSYTATTIGFGELPYAFTDAQRAWVTFTVYLTVIGWLYSIGKLLTLMQDPALRGVLELNRFVRQVRSLRSRFYLIAGCGETGGLLLDALEARNRQAVVIDINPDRIQEVRLRDYHLDVPALTADARLPESLLQAGLKVPRLEAVIALTNVDEVNLAVGVTTKLLRPHVPVLCRAESHEIASNMASFGTDAIVNPFEVFGELLAMAVHAPSHYLLYEWLTGVPDTPLELPTRPPHGRWIVCGYGRFGKAVVANLTKEGMEIVIVEADPALTKCPDCIIGKGTDAATLRAAGIEDAVGIVAGTNRDIDNLSIVMTARELKPDLFVVLRKNLRAHDALFDSFGADITMQPSHILAHEFLEQLTTPLLSRFFLLSRHHSNEWANELISRISAVVGDTVPELWDLQISEEMAASVTQLTAAGIPVQLAHLQREPGPAQRRIGCLPLLLQRGLEETLLPDDELVLRHGDVILFCGNRRSRHQQAAALFNVNLLRYIVTGEAYPGGTFWRWVRRRSAKVNQGLGLR